MGSHKYLEQEWLEKVYTLLKATHKDENARDHFGSMMHLIGYELFIDICSKAKEMFEKAKPGESKVIAA